MPLWIEWLQNHWLSFFIAAGVVIAIIYVVSKRKQLFYKE
ncbi:hypothetical protein FHS15_003126 [Paenibacillus castaneae]|nr:hypothetical protein [Paenibacillus castaneae]